MFAPVAVHDWTVKYRDENFEPTPPRVLLGGVVAIAFGALLTWQAFMPTTYLYQQPGPALSVAEIDGEQVIHLTNTDAPTYPSDTDLHLTTVSTFGNPDASVRGAAAVEAYLDNDKDLVPIRTLYTADDTNEDVRAASAAMMAESQVNAVLAGYGLAGIDVPTTTRVAGFTEGSGAEGKLRVDDVLLSLQAPGEDSFSPVNFTQLREYLATIDPGTELAITVERNGTEHVETVVTRDPGEGGEGSLIGVYITTEVQEGAPGADIALENIGGPSAGQMFALEIYDQLTEGSVGGDNIIAGTGTVDETGDIGPIGGIEHKLKGARAAGATYFLAPVENCDEVIGNEVDGLQVIAVDNLEDSLAALEAIKTGDTADLPTCTP